MTRNNFIRYPIDCSSSLDLQSGVLGTVSLAMDRVLYKYCTFKLIVIDFFTVQARFVAVFQSREFRFNCVFVSHAL
jgi:hypothetical protein